MSTLHEVWPAGMEIDEAESFLRFQAAVVGTPLVGDVRTVLLNRAEAQFNRDPETVCEEQVMALLHAGRLIIDRSRIPV